MGLIGDLFESYISKNIKVNESSETEADDTLVQPTEQETTLDKEQELRNQIAELQQQLTNLRQNNDLEKLEKQLLESQKLNMEYALQHNIGDAGKPQTFSEIMAQQPYHPSYMDRKEV